MHVTCSTFQVMSLLCSKGKEDELIFKWMNMLQQYFIYFLHYFLIKQVNYLFTDMPPHSFCIADTRLWCLPSNNYLSTLSLECTSVVSWRHKTHSHEIPHFRQICCVENCLYLDALEALAHLSVCWSTGKQVIDTVDSWGVRWPLRRNLWRCFTFHCSGA